MIIDSLDNIKMSWLKKTFGSQSSQERKVYFEKSTETTKNEDNSKIVESNFEEAEIEDSQCTNVATQSSQESWWSSWSELSQPFTSKLENWDLSNDEEEQWWESFCSQGTKNDKSLQSAGSSSQQKEHDPESSSASSSLQPKEDDSKNDDKENDTKVSFYIKVGKYKKFKYMWFSCLDTNMDYVNTNRINNFIYLYNIQKTEENFKKLEHVIEKRVFTIYKRILYMVDNCRIVEEDLSRITVEIDLFQHRKLLEDLTNKFFHKKLGNRKFEKKLIMVILLEIYF